ncbi:hypothetical protein HD554DRAFT_1829533 [Boletus coccyginus]|nr:hypothetical protein HD554DRAFT_1829533 [Boletus coccyginus]
MASRPISPAEPTKKHATLIQPNAHPYAIKTTSSALLSRSNSSPHSAHHTRHHYVPSPPSWIPTEMRRHYHSSSLSPVEGEVGDASGVPTIPAPLPSLPPSTVVASPDNSLLRAETMLGGGAIQSITKHHSYDQKHKHSLDQHPRPELYVGLPPNPKQWNTDELTTYLGTSFRSGNSTDGAKDDPSLVDILEYVRTRGLTGRELLRLTDADLASTPLSDVQRAQLLERSRTLRADVLRGRIYVDSYHSHEVSDNSNDIYSGSARSSTPFQNIRGASVSVDDLRLLHENNTGEGETALPPSSARSLHRSNSVSDASAQRYRDLARMRTRRRGRVKGLVETWERASTSGSECSTSDEGSMNGSEAESESEIDREFESISDSRHPPESPSDLPSARHDEPLHDTRSSVMDSAVDPQQLPLLTPPPPYTHMYTALGAVGDEEEEPSIEELLASSPDIPLRGARAWEADFGFGETVKRIPVSATADAGNASPLVMKPDTSRRLHLQDDDQQTRDDSVRSKGSGMRRSTGNKGNNIKTRKRVVTAIFTGSPSDDASEKGDEMQLGAHGCHANGKHDVVRVRAQASSGLQNDPDSALRALEESIAVTRAQLEAFKLRLEVVEVDTARQEAMQRRSGASEQAAVEVTESRSNETFVEAVRNRDVPERQETVSLTDIARTIVARAMGWLFPYGHLGLRVPEDHHRCRGRSGSRPGANGRYHAPVKRNGRFPVARMSCSIILVSFAFCAAVLRRIGFGRWVRRP